MLLLIAGSTVFAEPAPLARMLPPAEPEFHSSSKPLAAPKKQAVFAPTTLKVVPAVAVQPPMPPVPPMAEPSNIPDVLKEYQNLLEPPSSEALFGHLDSERILELRMRQQAMQRTPPDTVQFPRNPPLSTKEFEGRSFAQQVAFAEPYQVFYHRLYFEELNSERYGWSLGFIQPLVSTLAFYKDAIFLPHNFMSYPCRRYENSAGYCLPGDPVPYILYPPEITITGSIYEAAIAVGLLAAFP